MSVELWLYDRDLTALAALPEYDSLIETSRFSQWGTIAGRFPLDSYEVLNAAYFATVGDGDTVYVVEQVSIVTEKGRTYVEFEGRDAGCLLHTRTLAGNFRWTNKTPGYIVSDIIASFEAAAPKGTMAVHRFYNPTTGDHLYTINPAEGFAATAYKHEGVAWSYDPTTNTMPIKRFLNPATGGHILSIDSSEWAALIAAGWTLEGVAFYGAATGTDTYRLHRGPVDYLWTQNVAEKNLAVANGWTLDGVGWHIAAPGTTVGAREIANLVFGEGGTLGDSVADWQRSWGDAGEHVLDVLAAANLSMRSRLDGTTIYLDVFEPTEVSVPVGDAYGTASGSRLVRDVGKWKNYAVVLGEGEGSARVRYDVDLRAAGEELRELYVDARDIASTIDSVPLSAGAYNTVLGVRGAEKLAETRLVEYAEAKTDTPLSVGDVTWYDSGRFAAWLMVTESTTTHEGGERRYGVVLGEPPETLAKAIKRVTT